MLTFVFFFKQKTAYEMRISDWSSDVCSSDLRWAAGRLRCPRSPSRIPSHASVISFVIGADRASCLDDERAFAKSTGSRNFFPPRFREVRAIGRPIGQPRTAPYIEAMDSIRPKLVIRNSETRDAAGIERTSTRLQSSHSCA